MDYELTKIEKYFLNEKDPKLLHPNINNLDNKDLREIVKNKYNIV